ncbi:hypothetical protein A3K01_03880 [candidate division WWE3 bacterium RIFOXYD1_FULL_43_17]|uniref:DUF5652 domain-containing protein n=3 Tax=Katanobacteria TaxID=422282 RepID=A0A1F4XF74_UNCKA|nr:MAG: hypothetical protein UU59_C0001G0031 [candidate division WWE3 bacterium GW2011_GWE1_41_27]KKS60744.1 MAG: hypothetical protein UV26_C0002G0070 [candidate division WWE3 bacterium GW2011_GWF2_42_42]OGC80315.1 MAG: hypothetical protein A3K01_03880 [candidate division WWE3 bacterium RIFOXYD1_FULL_43_17]
MQTIQSITQNPYIWIPLLLVDLTLRGLALWKSSRKGEKYWFVALLVVNSVGILPLIYLLIQRYKEGKKA